MSKTTRAYAITAEDVALEAQRSGGDYDKVDVAKIIKLASLSLRDLGPRDVQLKILAASGEHNISHAALRDTVDIAKARGGKMFPGNSAVGEVTAVGSALAAEAVQAAEEKRAYKGFKVGDIALTQCNGEADEYGYPLRIWAYDQPNSDGWYSEEAVVCDWQLVQAPLECGLSLWEMAALPLRAPTAYHLWRRAIDMFRVKVTREQRAKLNVLSFGGGVGELFLMLAKAEGHDAFFCSGSPERRAALEKLGIKGIDQKKFERFTTAKGVDDFNRECKALTGGENMHLVCDMLRGPVFEAGLRVAARCGVNVSSGWQLSQEVKYNSTLMSVKQVTIDHMHYETIPGVRAATELYGKVFKPTVHKEIYSFEDLPRCMVEMTRNLQTGIPIVRVAKELPAKVRSLT